MCWNRTSVFHKASKSSINSQVAEEKLKQATEGQKAVKRGSVFFNKKKMVSMVDKTEQETLTPVANGVVSDVMYDLTICHNANQNML